MIRLGKLNEELRKEKERALTHFGAEENKSKYKDQRIAHLMKEVSDMQGRYNDVSTQLSESINKLNAQTTLNEQNQLATRRVE